MADSTTPVPPQPFGAHLQWMFEQEIINQWEQALLGVETMNAFLKADRGDQAQFWFGLNSALTGLANISKIFWPTGQANAHTRDRCEALRLAFGVDEGSSVLTRKVRDSMEHFDERLDTWYQVSESKNFVDHLIGGPNAVVGLAESDFARRFDPGTNVVQVFGESLDFQDLVSEVERVVSRVKERHEVMWWDRDAPG